MDEFKVGDRPDDRHRNVFERYAIVWAANISPSYKYLLLCLLGYLGSDDTCWPSQKTIAFQTGHTERHVRDKLKEMKGVNLIQVKRRGRKANLYRLNWQQLESLRHRPESCSGQEEVLPEQLSGQEEVLPEQLSGQGALLPENPSGQEAFLPENPSGQEAFLPEQVSPEQVSPENISGQKGAMTGNIFQDDRKDFPPNRSMKRPTSFLNRPNDLNSTTIDLQDGGGEKNSKKISEGKAVGKDATDDANANPVEEVENQTKNFETGSDLAEGGQFSAPPPELKIQGWADFKYPGEVPEFWEKVLAKTLEDPEIKNPTGAAIARIRNNGPEWWERYQAFLARKRQVEAARSQAKASQDLRPKQFAELWAETMASTESGITDMSELLTWFDTKLRMLTAVDPRQIIHDLKSLGLLPTDAKLDWRQLRPEELRPFGEKIQELINEKYRLLR